MRPSPSVQVDITFSRAPLTHRVPLFFTLPNSFRDADSVCLVVPPPQRTYQDKVAEADLGNKVKKIIDVKRLAAEYSEPVQMRALAKAFDSFFIHHDIQKFPKLLTGEFLTHQNPVWMPKGKNLAESVAAACATAIVPRRGFSTISVEVGHSGMTAAQIQENTESLVEQLEPWMAGGLQDVLTLAVAGPTKSGKKVSLPFFAKDFVCMLSKSVAEEQKETAKLKAADEPPKKQARKA